MRIGLVGCGRIAERGWVPAIARAPDAVLVAVADRERARCAAVAPGVEAFDGAGALAASGAVDAVIVATPVTAHLADAAAATAAGLPILVEKPPAVDAAAARALAALSPAPWVAFNRRFDERVQRLRAGLPRDGELALWLGFHYRRTGWAPHVVADDALLDVGPHLLDLSRWLSGSAIRGVRTLALERRRANVELRLSRGHATIACDADARYLELIEARDAGLTLVGRARRGSGVDSVSSFLAARRGVSPLVASLIAELDAFCSAVRGRPAPGLATGEDGIAVMEAIDAARRSAAEGGAWIEVEDRRSSV